MRSTRKPAGIPDAFDDPPDNRPPGARLAAGWLQAATQALGMWNLANWHPATRAIGGPALYETYKRQQP